MLDVTELKNLAKKMQNTGALKRISSRALHNAANIPYIASQSVKWFKNATPTLALTTLKIDGENQVDLIVPTKGAGSQPYAKYVWNGTGRFGPKKRDIKTKRAMVFTSGTETIFTRKSKGQKPNKWVLKAEKATRKKWKKEFRDELLKNLRKYANT